MNVTSTRLLEKRPVLNTHNFANFTTSNKSFYIGILESMYFEKM